MRDLLSAEIKKYRSYSEYFSKNIFHQRYADEFMGDDAKKVIRKLDDIALEVKELAKADSKDLNIPRLRELFKAVDDLVEGPEKK
jgi:hypothetical protein